jgi:hypothetical protein
MNNEAYPISECPARESLALHGQQPAVISEDEIVTIKLSAEPEGTADYGAYPYQPFATSAFDFNPEAHSGSAAEVVVAADEIDLDQLIVNDQLIIETAHSIYHFRLEDPELLTGRLIGGILGNQSAHAVIKFSCSDDPDITLAARRLKLGLSIVFNIEWGDSVRQLITSTITRLRLRSEVTSQANQIVKSSLIDSAFITLPIDERTGND